MRKNQRSAAGLYIPPGFAHTCSIVSTYGLYEIFNPAGTAESYKLQAPSLTMALGCYRINLERNNMNDINLKRIADALEEILRLVKEDQEKMRKINEKNN